MTSSNDEIQQPTVLCVDDEPNVLAALRRVLHKYGCRVLQAHDGASALDILETEQVEVLICDEAMPGMCGTDALRQAKTISPNTVRVLLTAHCNDPAVVLPAVNDGEVFRLLSKPWEDNEIRRVVADALGLEPVAWAKQQERVKERLSLDRPNAGSAADGPSGSAGLTDRLDARGQGER